MGKPTGFMEYERETAKAVLPKERILHFNEFHTPLSEEKQKQQGARCMNCGVPFCQSGVELMGMTSGCPLHNLIPEWNDLIYTGNWEEAYARLKKTNNFPEFTSRVCPALCEAACTWLRRSEERRVGKECKGKRIRYCRTRIPSRLCRRKTTQNQDRQDRCRHWQRSGRACSRRPAQ